MDAEDKEKIASIQRKALDEQIRSKREQTPLPGPARIRGLDYKPFWQRTTEWLVYIFAHGLFVILPFFLFFAVLIILVFIDSYFWQITISLPVILGSYILYRISRKPSTKRDRYSKIIDHLSHYNNQQAIADLHDLAEEGYIPAQLHIGGLYQFARHVTRNAKTAIKWYRRAAERGSAEAYYRLAKILADGAEGVDNDVSNAIRYYEKAIEGGMSDAAFSLAQIYEYGKGIDSDKEKAIEWYFRAGEMFKKQKRPEDLATAINSIKGLQDDYPSAT